MRKIVLAPDSFKGTLPSEKICAVLKERAMAIFPNAQVISLPIADGGEGSVDCFLAAAGGKREEIICTDPFFGEIKSYYAMLSDGVTAVVESAAACGLPLAEGRLDPLKTTTYGVGQTIKAAAEMGAKKIIVGLGGTCTNDFGCGAACACGVKFFDGRGKRFIPVGGTLGDVYKIDLSGKEDLDAEIIAMCDIDNPPYGESGAAKVFAPQKGANAQAVEKLDMGVKNICERLKEQYGLDLKDMKGGGAAGAMGAGMAAFFGATLKSGIDAVLDAINFDGVIAGADLIITGEGKLDGQSLRGKAVIGIARRAKKANVPVISVVGGADGDMERAYAEGVTAVFPINRLPLDFSVSRNFSEENLKRTAEDVFRLIAAVEKRGV